MRMNVNRHRFSKLLTAEEVIDYESFKEFAHQQMGTPYPVVAEAKRVQANIKKLFEEYPNAPYQSLTDLVRWAKAKEKHISLLKLVDMYRYAYEDGFMLILARGGTNDDKTLSVLIGNVHDPDVRDRMTRAHSASERNEVYRLYLERTLDEEGGVLDEPPHPQTYLDYCPLFIGQVIRYRTSPTDPFEYGTIVGDTPEHRVLVYNGVERTLDLPMIHVRELGEWVRCQK